MADLKYYDVILKPVITEKSMSGMADKKYKESRSVCENKCIRYSSIVKLCKESMGVAKWRF